MRAAFLRAEPVDERALPQRQPLLAAYLDLTSDDGPLHARGVADAGRLFEAGAPIPTYQINTMSMLRQTLEPQLRDPRELPGQARSQRWQLLCDALDNEAGLLDADRLRLAAVLSKLGCWQPVLEVVPPPAPEAAGTPPRGAATRLALLRCNAEVKSRSAAASASAQVLAGQILAARAEDESEPVTSRVAAAVNLVVHHAKDKDTAAVARWGELAVRLFAGAGGELGPVAESVYWRGLSFLPFLVGDRQTTSAMLDDAERAARAALAGAPNDLLAVENLHPVLETRARAWSAFGRHELAEDYYRQLIEHDGLDAKVHIRLADYLLGRGRLESARSSYEHAGSLGQPYAGYALTQAARCSHRLGEVERAVASLSLAVRADPRAVTAVHALRSLAGAAGLEGVADWAAAERDVLVPDLPDLPDPLA